MSIYTVSNQVIVINAGCLILPMCEGACHFSDETPLF